MADQITRREFVVGGTGAGLAAVLPAAAAGQAPAVHARAATPVAIGSANAHQFRNGGPDSCLERAFRLMTGGRDVLESLVEGVTIVELDPAETSVGYGGLPNADGVVQLDASVMHGPRRAAGAVAALEGVRTPAKVALAVMENTDHHLLVGEGAQRFARNMGFAVEADLNTERSRTLWLEWKRRTDPQYYPDPKSRADAGHRAGLAMVAEGLIDPLHYYGTIHCSAVNARGDVCGVTSTSGRAFKIPGRLGDSPILGAGLYVDNQAGAAGSTGRGEANLYNLACYQIVENLRRGMTPEDAGMDALRRVRASTVERRLLNSRGNPNFGLDFYVLDARGRFAGVSLYPSSYAVFTAGGGEVRPTEPLLPGTPEG